MSPVVTVIVVTWNGAHLLADCLTALDHQTMTRQMLTVVVDNASTDHTTELLATRPNVEVIRSPRNLGFAGGANLGLQRVRTPYAVVLNNDARPEPTWLEALVAGFGPGVGAVTSKVLLAPRYVLLPRGVGDVDEPAAVIVEGQDVTEDVISYRAPCPTLAVPVPDGATARVVATDGTGREILDTRVTPGTPRVDVLNSTGGVRLASGHGADRGYLEVDKGQYDGRPDVFSVCGAAAAFRTDVGSALGWFDPWLFMYYEDLDLSWRMRRAGWTVRFAPAARVRHQHAATSRIGSDLFLFHNRRNRLAVLARNATRREFRQALTARRVAAMPVAQALQGQRGPQASVAPRTKVSALASLAQHLPVILTSRLRDSRSRRKLSASASAWPPLSPPSTGA